MPLRRISSRAIDETITGDKEFTGNLKHDGYNVAKIDTSSYIKILDGDSNSYDLYSPVVGVKWDMTADPDLERTGFGQPEA